MVGGGPDDDGSSIDDDEFAQLLDPEFAASAVIDEPTADERARIARREDLQRRLADEEARAARAAEERHRQERREKGGRAHRRPMRIAVSVLLVIALAAAVSYALLRDPSAGSSSDAASSTTVVRPDGFPPAPKNESSKPIGTPPPLPSASGPFEFELTQPSGRGPVAWDPCRPIRYVINPAGAPPGGLDIVKKAIANTAAATGLDFQYEGATTETWSKARKAYQPDRYGKSWAPALIAWGTEADVASLGGYVVGLGGGDPQYDPGNSKRELYVTGSVVLDSADLGAALTEPGGADVVRSIIQHELGHMVGLDHVADPTQLMFTEGSPRQTNDWGAGDLRGLHALGSGACMPDA